MRQLILVVLFASLAAIESLASGQDTAIVNNLLTKYKSDVKWEQKILIGDINCDGVNDYIIKGKKESRVYVAIIIGPLSTNSRVTGLDFGIGNEKYQDSLSEKDPQMKIASLDYDLKEMIGSDYPGFRRSKTCKGIELGGEESDPMNLFWNYLNNNIDWWRL